MNSRIFPKRLITLAVAVWCGQVGPALLAQNTEPVNSGATVTAPATENPALKLSPSVREVLKLCRAHVEDAVTIAFIQNSDSTYSLSASDIVYLRGQGVSDAVVTAMLNQTAKVVAAGAQAPAQPAPTPSTSVWANSTPQTAPAYTAPAPVYVQPAPVYGYSSPGYYNYWPYWSDYWGYPTLSFSFGFGRCYYGGRYGYHRYDFGGYHGGYHSGGGRFSSGGHFGGGFSGGGHPGGGGGGRHR